MRFRLPALLGAVMLAVLVTVSAPALSSERYRPKAVDFELAPSGSTKSDAVEAPKRFNLVGMRWRGAGEPQISLRVRKDGGDWSRWTAVGAHADHGPDPGTGESSAGGTSDPVWVGEADQVQYRMSRHVPGLRLHFVNAEGTSTAGDRLRTAVRSAANSAVASLAGMFRGGTAQARQGQPAIVPRADWGADGCKPRRKASLGVVKAAHIHHTVSINDYSREEAPDIVLSICRFHRNSNGWDDIGYNFLVDKYGVIYEGRAGGIDKAVMGAQAQGYNSQTTGISNIGNYSDVPQSAAALQAMARLIRWKLPLHGTPTSGRATLTSAGGDTSRYPAGRRVSVPRILGHRDTNSTECPGDTLYSQLPELRRLVGTVGPEGTGTTLDALVSRRKLTYGSKLTVSGTLLNAATGAPVPSATVELQTLRGRWRTARRYITGADGRWFATIKPSATRYVRARFTGNGLFVGTLSRRTRVSVKPKVTLSKPPTRGRMGRRLTVRGKVAPKSKRTLYLVLWQEKDERDVKLGTTKVRVKKGRFRASFTPAGRGSYEFYVVAKADKSTARSATKRYPVRVGR